MLAMKIGEAVSGRPMSMQPNLNDPERKRIWDGLKKKGLSMNEASRMIGKNSTYLWHYFVKGTPRTLSYASRAALFKLLGFEEEAAPPPALVTVLQLPSAKTARQGLDLPVIPARSIKGLPPLDTMGEMTARPLALAGSASGFAVRLADAALAPRYGVGDLLYFNPGVPAEPLDGVCVELHSGERIVGILGGAVAGGHVTLRQYEPAVSKEYPLADVLRIAREVGVQRRGST